MCMGIDLKRLWQQNPFQLPLPEGPQLMLHNSNWVRGHLCIYIKDQLLALWHQSFREALDRPLNRVLVVRVMIG